MAEKKWYWGYIFDYISIFWLEYRSKCYRLHIHSLMKTSQSKFNSFNNFWLQIFKHFDNGPGIHIWDLLLDSINCVFRDSIFEIFKSVKFPFIMVQAMKSGNWFTQNFSHFADEKWTEITQKFDRKLLHRFDELFLQKVGFS